MGQIQQTHDAGRAVNVSSPSGWASKRPNDFELSLSEIRQSA